MTEQPLVDGADRQRIRTALHETLIVEAAAGTGKTTELVERIVNVLAHGSALVNQVVAVTFTEKAAGELKLRLREALDRARQELSIDSQRLSNVENALARLEEARINTIHGFCADLLRERPVEAQVDPLFTVLTEDRAQRLYNEAFAAWMQEQLADPPEGVRRALRRSSRSFGDWSGLLGPDEEGPVDRLRSCGWRLVEWRDFPSEWKRPAFDREQKIVELIAWLHRLAELTEQKSYDRDNLYLDTVAVRRVSQEIRLMERFDRHDYDGWEARLVDLSHDRNLLRARKGSGAWYGKDVARADVLAARQHFVDELERFREEADADLAALLRRDLMASVERYEQLKARAGMLDFLDLLLKARDLLREKHDVRQRLQCEFRAIFVDEFQDTDPLQAEILILLSSDDPSVADWRLVHPEPGKLFIVGDPKQSIYRFRRADVGTYRRVCALLEARGAARLQLTTSFRGQPVIQRAVNAAFAPTMTDDAQALQAAYVPLSPFRPERGDQPAVVALPVPHPYARTRLAATAIERSLPQAIGAFVEWLVNESGWEVTERTRPSGEESEMLPNDLALRAGHVRSTSHVNVARGTWRTARDTGRDSQAWVPLQARHICILFRRFLSFRQDVTRPYVDALEARGIPHLLVGGKSFHDREEVETLRTALAAVEWPDDELSVFATLRGALFAIGDEELLEYRHLLGRLHPFRIPARLEPAPGIQPPAPGAQSLAPDVLVRLSPIAEALALLRRLHSGRNHRPVADTIWTLLEATRAHVGFVLRSAGEQVLANVLHVAELARQYEAGGGASFRGFVEALQEAAQREQAPEAPILEEGSDGVRLMTVHKAKGLEFPVVILADLTAKLRPFEAGRHLDPERGLCALRLGGWSPAELLEHDAEESLREQAEGVRLAYVAATRARDLLVIPAIGDAPWEGGWLEPLNSAIYPRFDRRVQRSAPGCPPFRSKDTVIQRPNDDPAGEQTVSPGLHWLRKESLALGSGLSASGAGENLGDSFSESQRDERTSHVASRTPHQTDCTSHLAPRTSHGTYAVVWWDPHLLSLDAAAPFGVRREDLIVKEVSPTVLASGLARYKDWQRAREEAIVSASRPSIQVQTVTEKAAQVHAQPPTPGAQPQAPSARRPAAPVVSEIVELARDLHRPSGARFGTLVHGVLSAVPLDATRTSVEEIARLQGRILGASDEEFSAATAIVLGALAHPLFDRVRAAAANGACRREVPVASFDRDGSLVEGVIDLAFQDADGWVIVDFKTDRELDDAAEIYRAQLAAYVELVSAATQQRARGILVRV